MLTSQETVTNFYNTEVLSSAISQEVAELNCFFTSGDRARDLLLFSDRLNRKNGGRLSWGALKNYGHLDDGGIWFSGWSLRDRYETLWGVFKSVNPAMDQAGKPKKYEAPPRVEWSDIPVFLPKPDPVAQSQILDKYFVSSGDRAWDEILLSESSLPLAIVEGAKKAMSLVSHGLPAVGLYSLWSYANKTEDNKKVLKPEIEALIKSRKIVYLICDNDDKHSTRRQVEKAFLELANLIKEASPNCKIKIVDFGFRTRYKGIDDYLAYIGSTGYDSVLGLHNLLDWALVPIAWMQNRLENRKPLRSHKIVADRYLDTDKITKLLEKSNPNLIAIKSEKGTGKTELISKLVEQSKTVGRPSLIITHRISLSRANAARCGLPYWSDAKTGDRALGFGLCIDSLHSECELNFYASSWGGADVYIDEVDQVLAHLLNSSTCKKQRTEIFSTLQRLVNTANRVFLLDADLSQNTLNLFENLIQNPRVFVLKNTWKSEGYRVEISPDHDPTLLIADALDKAGQGKKLLILCDSQQEKSRYSSSSIARLINNATPENYKILRIDSATLRDKDHPAHKALADINTVIQKYDCIVCSPSVGTGISIDIKDYFDTVYGIFNGVLSASGVRQFLMRLRDTIPTRKIFLPSLGLITVGNGATSPEAVKAGNDKKFTATLKQLKRLETWDENQDTVRDVFTDYYYKQAAVTNHARHYFRELVLAGLESEGCMISSFFSTNSAIKKQIAEDIAENRDDGYSEDLQARLTAQDISRREYDRLSICDSLTESERQAVRKFEVKDKYKIPLSEELLRLDDDRFYGKIRLFYYLQFSERATEADNERLNNDKELGLFKPDTVKGLNSIKVKAIELLQLSQFFCTLELDRKLWSSDSPEIISTADKARKWHTQIKDIFGFKINNKWTNLRIVSHLLDRIFGLKLELEYRENKGGDRTRYYASALIPDLYQAIVNAWDSDYLARQEDSTP